MNNQIEKRFYVKIRLNKKERWSASAKVVYYRNGLKFDLFYKWKWYFEYRAALLKVKYPRGLVELSMGAYDYELPSDTYKEKLSNMIRAAKRNCTILDKKIDRAKKHWNQLFPIEQHPDYTKVVQKQKRYQEKLIQLEREMEEFITSRKTNPKIMDRLPMIKTSYINRIKSYDKRTDCSVY